LPLTTRITAADHLCRLGLGHIGTIRTLKIIIEGGIPSCRSFESFSPEMQRDLLYIQWCFDHGMLDPNLDGTRALYLHAMQVKGHA
jgi:hypothetical protein